VPVRRRRTRRDRRVTRPWRSSTALLGVGSLVVFAVALTRVDSVFAGRTYAAYGGIYIVASLVWLWLAEGQRPSLPDLIGAGIAIAGALVIIAFAPKAP
jgi:small multidrug resistance family-3 protein